MTLDADEWKVELKSGLVLCSDGTAALPIDFAAKLLAGRDELIDRLYLQLMIKEDHQSAFLANYN